MIKSFSFNWYRAFAYSFIFQKQDPFALPKIKNILCPKARQRIFFDNNHRTGLLNLIHRRYPWS